LLIGLAAAVKLTPAIFILFLLAIAAWRPAARAVGAFVGLTALAWLIAPADSQLFWTKLLFDTSRIGDVGDRHNNSLRFVLANLPIGTTLQLVLWLALAIVVVVIGLRRAALAWRAGHLLYAMIVVGCVQGLVSPITWQHHLIFLLLALLLLPMPGDALGPRMTWTQLAVLGTGWLFLLDPVAFGVNSVTSALRCLVLLAIVAGLVLRPTSWLETEGWQNRRRSDPIVPMAQGG
jgi:alpha-1,2-mannosyltransferase